MFSTSVRTFDGELTSPKPLRTLSSSSSLLNGHKNFTSDVYMLNVTSTELESIFTPMRILYVGLVPMVVKVYRRVTETRHFLIFAYGCTPRLAVNFDWPLWKTITLLVFDSKWRVTLNSTKHSSRMMSCVDPVLYRRNLTIRMLSLNFHVPDLTKCYKVNYRLIVS